MRTSVIATMVLVSLWVRAAQTGETKPARSKPAVSDFVGSARCATCHKRQYQLWSGDWHARALSPAEPRTVVGRFDPPFVFDQRGTHAETLRVRDSFRMKAQGSDGSFGTFPIDWVIGGRRMQDFVTTFPDGRLQVLPIYFHVTGKGEWVDYTTIKQGALTKEHPRRSSNRPACGKGA